MAGLPNSEWQFAPGILSQAGQGRVPWRAGRRGLVMAAPKVRAGS